MDLHKGPLMYRFDSRQHAPLLLLLSLLALPTFAPAAEFCASTSANFLTALQTAANSSEDDTIRIAGTTLTIPRQVTHTVQGALAIRGGICRAVQKRAMPTPCRACRGPAIPASVCKSSGET